MGKAVDMKHAAGVFNPGFDEAPHPDETMREGFYASQESMERHDPSGVICPHCDMEFEEGYLPDPCIGKYLPGVASACCGHGDLNDAVVNVADGALPDQVVQDLVNSRLLWGEDALNFFNSHGVGPLPLGFGASAKPIVAVLISCYNQAHLVSDAVNSVLAQETEEIDAKVHVVVCNDGSSDNSAGVLEELRAANPERMRVLNVTNRHLPGAFNAALLAVPKDTEFIVTLAADDWLASNFIGECLKAIRAANADAAVSQFTHYGKPHHGYDVKISPKTRNPTPDQIWEWKETYVYGVAMWKRSVLVEMGGFHPFTAGNQDWDIWYDFFAHGYRVAYADATWFYYRYVAESLNNTQNKEGWDRDREEMRRHHKRDTLPGPEWPNASGESVFVENSLAVAIPAKREPTRGRTGGRRR